jgi:anti-anti-sigma factor
MNVTTDRTNGVSVVHVNESRLMYPVLSEFTTTITSLIGAGERRVLLDLSSVTAVDSATVGCLMDLCRQANEAGGLLKLSGVQKRVETMLAMTGAEAVLDIHPDAPSAIRSFGA